MPCLNPEILHKENNLSVLLFSLRAVLVVVWIILGLMSVSIVFPLASLRIRSCMNLYWSRVLMRLCGVAVRIKGEPKRSGPVLWVANHVSWVDIFVLNSIRPTSFVAKSDIRRWPVLGWLVAGAGTVFIGPEERRLGTGWVRKCKS